MRTLIRVAAAVLSVFAATSAQGVPRYDVIDMHFHAELPDAEGPPGGKICAPYTSWSPRDPGQPIDKYLDWFTINPACKHVLVAPVDAAELRDRSVAVLRRYNALALAGGSADIVEDYRAHAAGRILPSAGFGSDGKFPAIAELRQLYKDGKLTALSEITTQYAGIAPDDPRLEPYFALAEQLDIPVGIHMGRARPARPIFRHRDTASPQATHCVLNRSCCDIHACESMQCMPDGRWANP